MVNLQFYKHFRFLQKPLHNELYLKQQKFGKIVETEQTNWDEFLSLTGKDHTESKNINY